MLGMTVSFLYPGEGLRGNLMLGLTVSFLYSGEG